MGNKKSYWKVLFVIAVVLVIVGLSYICWFMFQMYTSGSEYGNLRATVTDSTESSDNSSNNSPNNNDLAASTCKGSPGLTFLYILSLDCNSFKAFSNVRYLIICYVG